MFETIEVVAAFGVVEGRGQYASERCVILFRFGEIFSNSGHEAHARGCASDSLLRLVKYGIESDAVKTSWVLAESSASSSHESATSTARSFPLAFLDSSICRSSIFGNCEPCRFRSFPTSPMANAAPKSPVKSRKRTSSQPEVPEPSSFWNNILNDRKSKHAFAPKAAK